MRPSEYYFKEGCYIEEWHNSPNDAAMSVARVRVEPHQSTRLHSLCDTEERYVLLQGVADVTVGPRTWRVAEGDVVVIPNGTPQRIKNLENTDLLFLAICTPRFDVHNYQDLQDE
ncbi:hypothetical protein GCM10008090_25080 [Arenicella chitinivorans]|uniref:Cupin type-2 domain-containing protein n=1 Tax=Arenicella chitinivorans TaxID=1329800 RepID=A0A918RYN6_9GAMM|nr:cupin domain-containing protein [Arenicella chitinivorans]GHA14288.1 hypothetical protein GCM10008090_25080 [Arenicella chitinivorans]